MPKPAAPPQARGIFDQSRPLWQVMVFFIIPLVGGNILQSASGTINSIYIGRLIGVDGLAALSAFFPILFLLISFLIGLSTGSTVLIGQAYGARDDHKLKQVAGTSITFTFLVGCTVAIAGALTSRSLLQVLGTPPNILADSEAYARIIFYAIPLLFVFFAYVTFMRGTGDATTPFIFLLVTTAISLIVTPALILGWFGLPRLGLVSAAVSAVIATFVGLVALIIYLRSIRHPLMLDAETVHDLRLNWPILAQIIRIGIPTGIQVIFVSLAELAVISFVNRFGSHATAAYGAVNQIVSYVQFPAISIGIAASIFGAQSIGARREDLLRRVVHSAVGINYALGGVTIVVCYLFGSQLIGWFITDPQTHDIAVRLLYITLWSYLVFGNSAILSGVMRASGTVLWPTTIGVFAIWGIEVPVAYALSHSIGLTGIWIGYPAAFVVALTLQFTYYSLFWKHKTHARLI